MKHLYVHFVSTEMSWIKKQKKIWNPDKSVAEIKWKEYGQKFPVRISYILLFYRSEISHMIENVIFFRKIEFSVIWSPCWTPILRSYTTDNRMKTRVIIPPPNVDILHPHLLAYKKPRI